MGQLRNGDIGAAGNKGQWAAIQRHEDANLDLEVHNTWTTGKEIIGASIEGSFGSEEEDELAAQDLEHYIDLYGQPLVGTNRAVFDRGDGTMIKMPICDYGQYANVQEGRAVLKPDKWYFTRGHSEHSPNGFHVLVVEKVEPIFHDDPEYPDWADFIDCGQVGRTADGRIVAYDL